jgi:hypothetical protein
LRQFGRFAGTQTRYSEWEPLSAADYFFEEELPQPISNAVAVSYDSNVNAFEENRKIFRDVFKDFIK